MTKDQLLELLKNFDGNTPIAVAIKEYENGRIVGLANVREEDLELGTDPEFSIHIVVLVAAEDAPVPVIEEGVL